MVMRTHTELAAGGIGSTNSLRTRGTTRVALGRNAQFRGVAVASSKRASVGAAHIVNSLTMRGDPHPLIVSKTAIRNRLQTVNGRGNMRVGDAHISNGLAYRNGAVTPGKNHGFVRNGGRKRYSSVPNWSVTPGGPNVPATDMPPSIRHWVGRTAPTLGGSSETIYYYPPSFELLGHRH